MCCEVSEKTFSKNEVYLQVLNSMHEDDTEDCEEYLEYTKEWITRIDRGGLYRVSDETYLLFYWMELSVRTFLQGHNINISKAIDAIISSEQEISCWSLICNLRTENSDKLLIHIGNASR